jgi:hypothetical protein
MGTSVRDSNMYPTRPCLPACLRACLPACLPACLHPPTHTLQVGMSVTKCIAAERQLLTRSNTCELMSYSLKAAGGLSGLFDSRVGTLFASRVGSSCNVSRCACQLVDWAGSNITMKGTFKCSTSPADNAAIKQLVQSMVAIVIDHTQRLLSVSSERLCRYVLKPEVESTCNYH